MSHITLDREEIINFLVLYCNTTHIPTEDKTKEVERVLDQVFEAGYKQGKEEGGNCG